MIKKLKSNKFIGASSSAATFSKPFWDTLNEPIIFLADLSFSIIVISINLKTVHFLPLFKKDDHTLQQLFTNFNFFQSKYNYWETNAYLVTLFLNAYNI